MSKEDGRMKQHIVPKAHLNRFTDERGLLHVYRIVDEMHLRVFERSPDNVCCQTNYYDENPFDPRSIERFLKIQEDRGQPAVDSVLEHSNNIAINRKAIRYVGNLVGRSRRLDLARNASNSEGAAPDALTDDDLMLERQQAVIDSHDRLLLHGYDEFLCLFLWNGGQTPFITGDIPFAIKSLDPLKSNERLSLLLPEIMTTPFHFGDPKLLSKNQRIEEELSDIMRDYVIICPLSPRLCIIVYHDSVRDVDVKVRALLNPNPVDAVNRMILESSVNEVYSDVDMEWYIGQMLVVTPRIITRTGMPDDFCRIPNKKKGCILIDADGDEIMVEDKKDQNTVNENCLASILLDVWYPPQEFSFEQYLDFVKKMKKTGLVQVYRTILSPQSHPGMPAAESHEMISADGKLKVGFSINKFFVEEVAPTSWSGFIDLASKVIDIHKESFHVDGNARVGFRTIYEIKSGKGVEVDKNLLSDKCRFMFMNGPGKETECSINTLHEMPDGTKIRRIVSTATLRSGAKGLVIDIDAFDDRAPIRSDVPAILQALSKNSTILFRDSTSEVLHDLPFRERS